MCPLIAREIFASAFLTRLRCLKGPSCYSCAWPVLLQGPLRSQQMALSPLQVLQVRSLSWPICSTFYLPHCLSISQSHPLFFFTTVTQIQTISCSWLSFFKFWTITVPKLVLLPSAFDPLQSTLLPSTDLCKIQTNQVILLLQTLHWLSLAFRVIGFGCIPTQIST